MPSGKHVDYIIQSWLYTVLKHPEDQRISIPFLKLVLIKNLNCSGRFLSASDGLKTMKVLTSFRSIKGTGSLPFWSQDAIKDIPLNPDEIGWDLGFSTRDKDLQQQNAKKLWMTKTNYAHVQLG